MKRTERDSAASSASLACLGPEGLPTPRRSFVYFRLSVRCETESTSSGRACASRPESEKALAAGKARMLLSARLRRPRQPPENAEKRNAPNVCRFVHSAGVPLPRKASVPLRSFNLLRLALGARGKLRDPSPAAQVHLVKKKRSQREKRWRGVPGPPPCDTWNPLEWCPSG
jgi:hypothetical protein